MALTGLDSESVDFIVRIISASKEAFVRGGSRSSSLFEGEILLIFFHFKDGVLWDVLYQSYSDK